MALSSPAHAAVVGEDGATVHRLTPEQIAAIGDKHSNVVKEPIAIIGDEFAPPKRKIHGEIGFGIGTGGYSEVFGTVVAPLGGNGVFAFTFAQQNGGNYHRYRRR